MTPADLDQMIAEMLANAKRLGKTLTRQDCIGLIRLNRPTELPADAA